jgi:hypothetical protein
MLGHRGCRLRSPIRRLPRCRPGPSSRPPSRPPNSTGAPVVPEIMVPLVGLARSSISSRHEHRRRGEGGDRRRPASDMTYQVGTMIELPRAAIRRPHEIAEVGRVLLLRHQRPDPDHLRHFARRRRVVPGTYQQPWHHGTGSVRVRWIGRRRRAGPHRVETRPGDPARHQARHLRRTWRRPGLGRFCEGHRSRLCLLLALPRADRPAGRGAGGHREEARRLNRRLPTRSVWRVLLKVLFALLKAAKTPFGNSILFPGNLREE